MTEPDISLSFCVLTHNAPADVERVLTCFADALRPDREIVVIDDCSDAETKAVLDRFAARHGVRVFERPLNKHFGKQRTFMKEQCRGRYLFILDSDELAPDTLMEQLDDLIALMDEEEIDGIQVPRINTVQGLTEADRRHYRVKANDQDWLDWPDHQMRLLLNRPELHWVNSVHESMVGIQRVFYLPADPTIAIRHQKSIEAYRRSKDFYRTFLSRRVEKARKTIRKRVKWLQRHLLGQGK